MIATAAGTQFTPDSTVADYLERRFLTVHSRSQSAASVKSYRVDVRKYDRFLAWRCAQHGQQTRPALIADLVDELLAEAMRWDRDVSHNSQETANRLYRSIAAIWRAAWRDKLLASPTMLRPFPAYKRRPLAWFPDQFQAILTAAAQRSGYVGDIPACEFWPALLCVLGLTGSRISAAMAIEWTHVDLQRGWLTIPAETQKHRADQLFELNPETVQALRVIYRPRQRLVFDWPYDPGARRGDATSWKTLTKHYRQIVVAAGLRPTVDDVVRADLFHGIRRCVATWIAAAEGLEAASNYLGHSHVSVTERYLDWRQIERKFSAVKSLPRFQIGRLRVATPG